jgi:hypothetical protein
MSYSQPLLTSMAPLYAGDNERIRQQLLPVESFFSALHTTTVVVSTLPQHTLDMARKRGFIPNDDLAQLVLATIVRLDRRIASEATAHNGEMNSIIAKLLILHCAAQALVMMTNNSARSSGPITIGSK